jgi:hypothetical protein
VSGSGKPPPSSRARALSRACFEERRPYRKGGRAHRVVEEVSKLPLHVRTFEYEDNLWNRQGRRHAERARSRLDRRADQQAHNVGCGVLATRLQLRHEDDSVQPRRYASSTPSEARRCADHCRPPRPVYISARGQGAASYRLFAGESRRLLCQSDISLHHVSMPRKLLTLEDLVAVRRFDASNFRHRRALDESGPTWQTPSSTKRAKSCSTSAV